MDISRKVRFLYKYFYASHLKDEIKEKIGKSLEQTNPPPSAVHNIEVYHRCLR